MNNQYRYTYRGGCWINLWSIYHRSAGRSNVQWSQSGLLGLRCVVPVGLDATRPLHPFYSHRNRNGSWHEYDRSVLRAATSYGGRGDDRSMGMGLRCVTLKGI